uniref:Thioredoxin domain-containing protein n=1 Tax=Hanusia phi TaxID=3032 RepID=A0A7S0HY34_9CRYP
MTGPSASLTALTAARGRGGGGARGLASSRFSPVRGFNAPPAFMALACLSMAAASTGGGGSMDIHDAMVVDQEGRKMRLGDAAKGRTVGLYFAGEWCPMCRSFTPKLKEYFNEKAQDKQTGNQKATIVFVSSDFSKEAADSHFKNQGNWLYLDYDSPLRQQLKQKFRIWGGMESSALGFDRRSGIPGMVVIGSDGNEVTYMNTESKGIRALEAWDLDANAW